MDLTIELARQVLAAQPFSTLIGAELTAFDEGAATLEVPIRDELRQQFGLVHGGVLSYAADNVITFAGGSVLGPNVLTAGFSISYLRPAEGDRLRAEGVVTSSTRRQALCRCEIYVEREGKDAVLCAAAQGTVTRVDRETDTRTARRV